MLKNIDWKTMLLSKTFWSGLIAFVTVAFHAFGVWKTGGKAQAITEFMSGFSAFLFAIGLKDATSGPIN